MLRLALKMLYGDRAKYAMLVCGLTFCSLLMVQQASVFCGLMQWTTVTLRNIGAPIWIADAKVEQANEIVPMRNIEVNRVRSIEGIDWAVPLSWGIIQARLRDGSLNIREGEYAQLSAKDPVLLPGQIDQLQLRADVDEDSASRVRPGCAATAFIKGRRDFPIAVKFVRIEPYILPKQSLTGESSERVDTRVLQIIFHFSQPGLPVYVGQQMDVFLDAGTGKPTESAFKQQDRRVRLRIFT